MPADGGGLAALWEINGDGGVGAGVGVSRTGPGVITLIDTSPHTHAHGPQGPIRGPGSAVEGGWKAGTGAAGERIRGVIALLIFGRPCVTPPDEH